MNSSTRVFLYFLGLAVLSLGMGIEFGAGSGYGCAGVGIIAYSILGKRSL